MKRIIAIGLMLAFLSACAPSPREALVSPVPVETTKEIDRNERIADKEEFLLQSGNLSDLYPTEDTLHMGYDGEKKVFYFKFSDDSLWQADIETGEMAELGRLDPTEGHSAFSFQFEYPWLIWSESKDEATYVGASISEDWSIWALNVETKGKIKIDGENEFFPKDRNFMANPWVMSCEDNILAYSGYEADDTGVYEAVKMYDFEKRELTTLARQNEDLRGYSDVYVRDGHIVFGVSTADMEYLDLIDNVIYSYDISSGKLSVIENEDDLSLPVSSGSYIAALRRYSHSNMEGRIFVYDMEQNKWIRTVDHKSIIYDDIPHMSTMERSSMVMCGDYMVWRQIVDDRLDVFSIRENAFFDLLDEGRRVYSINASFENNMLVWSDAAEDHSDQQLRYAIFK